MEALIVVGIVFFVIYGIPIMLTNKVHKGKMHEHKWSYCQLRSCPHLKKGISGITDVCELDECIYKKEKRD